MMAAIEFLVSLDACSRARNWAETVRTHGRPATELHLWQQCQRGDWMLWFASAVRVERADLQCALKAVVAAPLHPAAGLASEAALGWLDQMSDGYRRPDCVSLVSAVGAAALSGSLDLPILVRHAQIVRSTLPWGCVRAAMAGRGET